MYMYSFQFDLFLVLFFSSPFSTVGITPKLLSRKFIFIYIFVHLFFLSQVMDFCTTVQWVRSQRSRT